MTPSPSQGRLRELAEGLLRLVLPPGDHGESIIGDLREERALRIRQGRSGPDAWFIFSAVGLAARYAPRRLARAWIHAARRRRLREGFMGNLWADLRFAIRVLLKTPRLSAIAILTIAVGVGITTHTFSVVYGAILRGLPLPDDQQLVDVHENNPARNSFENFMRYPDHLAVAEEVRSFSGVAGYSQGTVSLAGEDAPPERYRGAFITANLLDLIGVAPALGRGFTEADDQPGAPLTVILSWEVWQNRFAGEPTVLGRTIRTNAEAATVIGVMPAGFYFPFDERMWLPLRYDAAAPRESARFLGTVARLADGAGIEAAAGELARLGARIAAEYPETNAGRELGVQKFEHSVMPPEIRAILWSMLAAVFGVLLIACVNVANLLLARATMRSKEMAVRTAMGASRWRVTRQLVVEAGVLALLGSILGVALAYAGVDLFNRAIVDIQKPYWIDIRVDTPALLFSLLLTGVAALVAGVIPARRAVGVNTNAVLKDESRGSSSRAMGRFSSGLVIAELAVSCALLVGAGLMIKSVINLRDQDLGFRTEQIFTGRVGLFEGDYPTRDDRQAFFRDLLRELNGVPGVERASLVSSLPGSGAGRWGFGVEGETYASDAEFPQTWGIVVAGDYFDVMGIRRLRGRTFDAVDSEQESDLVLVVNESFANRYFPGEDALGRRIRLGLSDSTSPWMRIVGVVGDTHVGGGVGGIGNDRQPRDMMYLPLGRIDFRFMSIAASSHGPPLDLAAPIRARVSALDSNLPVYDIKTMTQVMEDNTWAFGLFGSLFTLFGAVALFLAAVGLSGVMAFSVTQRLQEIGVRMALGARPRDILRLVLRRGTIQLLVGLVAGLALGWVLANPLGVLLYGVRPLDPGVYGLIAGTLLVAGVLAALLPARTATRADPVQAMRT